MSTSEEEDTPASRTALASQSQLDLEVAPDGGDEAEDKYFVFLVVPLFSLNKPFKISAECSDEGQSRIINEASEKLESGQYRVFDCCDWQEAILVDGSLCWEEVEDRD